MQNAFTWTARSWRHEIVFEGGVRALLEKATVDVNRTEFRGRHSQSCLPAGTKVEVSNVRPEHARVLLPRDHERRSECHCWRQVQVSCLLAIVRNLWLLACLTAFSHCSLSKCQYFDQSFELPPNIEFILVQCKGSHSKDDDKKKARTVYSNAHAIVRRKPQMQKVFDSFKTLYPSERPLSVLMMGIDSVSRLNLIRAMPNTAQHLYDTGWFELKGYNKVRNF